jgi:sialic acid synthase SpsE
MEIIAEIGQNFNGEMRLAEKLIRVAAEMGADVVKFQLYDARALFPKENNPWFEYNCKTELSRSDLGFLKNICDDLDIEFLASPFDVERVSWLEELGVKRYKIASRSISDNDLLSAVIETGKPIIASLGMWDSDNFPQIEAQEISFLYCISKYPALLTDLKLGDVDFNRYTGFSDHSIGISAAVAAFARGAKIVEKHFTLDKTMYGPDHECSMTPNELTTLSNIRDDFQICL